MEPSIASVSPLLRLPKFSFPHPSDQMALSLLNSAVFPCGCAVLSVGYQCESVSRTTGSSFSSQSVGDLVSKEMTVPS
eukprot:7978502-Ditylum_brightwellii.AAC.1